MSFPHYFQHDKMDCGPTCLQIISKYYGKSISADVLRKKSQLNREGVSLLGISQAATSIGFNPNYALGFFFQKKGVDF